MSSIVLVCAAPQASGEFVKKEIGNEVMIRLTRRWWPLPQRWHHTQHRPDIYWTPVLRAVSLHSTNKMAEVQLTLDNHIKFVPSWCAAVGGGKRGWQMDLRCGQQGQRWELQPGGANTNLSGNLILSHKYIVEVDSQDPKQLKSEWFPADPVLSSVQKVISEY